MAFFTVTDSFLGPIAQCRRLQIEEARRGETDLYILTCMEEGRREGNRYTTM